MTNYDQKKAIIGLVLAILYLFFGSGQLFVVFLAAMINQEITLDLWGSVLGAGIFLLAFISVRIKLKFQRVGIGFFFLDFFFFPLAIPFYYYVLKSFHELPTFITIKRRTIKKWASIQFIILITLDFFYGLIWFILFIAAFEAVISLGIGSMIGFLIVTIFALSLLVSGFVGSLLVLSYTFKKIPIPNWIIILSLLTPVGVTGPLGLLLLDQRMKIEEESSIYYPNNFPMTS